jgi:AcrR family transcriptional regulator
MARPVVIRETLDRAALRLFAEKGVAETSIRDIAEAAGVSQGAMYRHYASKDDLVTHLFVEHYGNLGRELDQIRATEATLTGRLDTLARTFCALFDRDREMFRFLLLVQHGQLSRMPEGLRHPVAVLEDIMAEAIAAGDLPGGDPAFLTALVLGLVVQTGTFHVYGALTGGLTPLSTALAAACIAAVEAAARSPEV